MATATLQQAEPVIPPPLVIVELTEEEAQTLRDVMKHIGGDMFNSRRRHMHALSIALTDAGIHGTDGKDIDTMAALYFTEA